MAITVQQLAWVTTVVLGTSSCGGRSGLSGFELLAASSGSGGAGWDGPSDVEPNRPTGGRPSVQHTGGGPSIEQGSGGIESGATGDAGGSTGTGGVLAEPSCAETTCERNAECVELDGVFADCDCPRGTFGQRCELSVSKVAVDYGYSCALLSDGSLRCWSGLANLQAPPQGSFVDVSAGGYFFCALRADGSSVCWKPDSSEGRLEPAEPLQSIAAGNDFACGLTPHDALHCWGNGASDLDWLKQDLPPGTFLEVAANDTNACALRADGTIICFAGALASATLPQAEGLHDLVVGYNFGCALDASSRAQCWGGNGVVTQVPDVEFIALGSAAFAAFGITSDGIISCWGQCDDFQDVPTEEFVQTDGGPYTVCGVTRSGQSVCWGDNGSVPADPPPGPFVQLELAQDSFNRMRYCGLHTNQSAVCWTSESTPDEFGGPFLDIALTAQGLCGVLTTGELWCEDPSRLAEFNPQDRYVGLNASPLCALTNTADIECFSASYGNEPLGPFEKVVPGSSACALRPTGELVCWGNDAGSTLLPPGFYSEAAVDNKWRGVLGGPRGCVVDLYGGAACFGTNADQPPLGPLHDLEVDVAFCALRKDSTAVCWNRARDDFGPTQRQASSPPPGPFTSLSVHGATACGIRPSGSAHCWNNSWPQEQQ